MLGTNHHFETLIRTLDARIGMMERTLLQSGDARVGGVLEELWARRRSLRLLILNRRVEAAKPVVDFQRWRDGNGAIFLCANPLPTRRKAKTS